MSIADGIRKLPTPLLVLLVASKLVVGLGLGVLLAGVLAGCGLWILILGIVLSIIPAVAVLRRA